MKIGQTSQCTETKITTHFKHTLSKHNDPNSYKTNITANTTRTTPQQTSTQTGLQTPTPPTPHSDVAATSFSHVRTTNSSPSAVWLVLLSPPPFHSFSFLLVSSLSSPVSPPTD